MYYEDEEENNDPYASIKSQQVRDYMRQRAEAKKQLDADQSNQKIGDYAGVAGDIASGFVNANKPSHVILHNSWQGMGSAPKVSKVEDKRIDFSGAKNILDGQAARSKAAYDQVDKDFDSSMKAGQLDKSLQRDDPTSKSSKSAQTLARSALASKAKEAEAAGDRDGAKALREMDVSGMSASEAKEFYDGVKMTDYKDVLNNQAADRRIKMQVDAFKSKQDTKAADKATKSEEGGELLSHIPERLWNKATDELKKVDEHNKASQDAVENAQKMAGIGAIEGNVSGAIGGRSEEYSNLKANVAATVIGIVPGVRSDADYKNIVVPMLPKPTDTPKDAQAKVEVFKKWLASKTPETPVLTNYGKADMVKPVPAPKPTANKPKTVTQNGHTYTWNGNEYE